MQTSDPPKKDTEIMPKPDLSQTQTHRRAVTGPWSVIDKASLSVGHWFTSWQIQKYTQIMLLLTHTHTQYRRCQFSQPFEHDFVIRRVDVLRIFGGGIRFKSWPRYWITWTRIAEVFVSGTQDKCQDTDWSKYWPQHRLYVLCNLLFTVADRWRGILATWLFKAQIDW